MAVNNEIGVIQSLAEIGAIVRKHRGVFFHTDAAQAVGKIPVDVNAINCDLLSISGHKLYGPKGVGAIYVRRRPRVRLEPIINGGGQERGLRSGTLPSTLAVGLGEACRLAQVEMQVSKSYQLEAWMIFAPFILLSSVFRPCHEPGAGVLSRYSLGSS
jgi:cysteine desulfurase